MTVVRRLKIQISGEDALRAHDIQIKDVVNDEFLRDVEAFEIHAKVGKPVTVTLHRFAHDEKGRIAVDSDGELVRYDSTVQLDTLDIEAIEE